LSEYFAAEIKGVVIQDGVEAEHKTTLSFLAPHGVVANSKTVPRPSSTSTMAGAFSRLSPPVSMPQNTGMTIHPRARS
jgi:hypothetical protein